MLPVAPFNTTSLAAPVAVNPTVPDPPAVTAFEIVIAPLELRLMLPLAAVVVPALVPSVPVFTTVTLPVFCVIPASVRFALFVSATLPVPAFVAAKLVTALPLPVRLVPPLDLVVSNPATTPVVPTASAIVPDAPVPPSAVSVSAFVPSPEVSTLLIVIPPVLLISVVPPLAFVVATAALTLIAPV